MGIESSINNIVNPFGKSGPSQADIRKEAGDVHSTIDSFISSGQRNEERFKETIITKTQESLKDLKKEMGVDTPSFKRFTEGLDKILIKNKAPEGIEAPEAKTARIEKIKVETKALVLSFLMETSNGDVSKWGSDITETFQNIFEAYGGEKILQFICGDGEVGQWFMEFIYGKDSWDDKDGVNYRFKKSMKDKCDMALADIAPLSAIQINDLKAKFGKTEKPKKDEKGQDTNVMEAVDTKPSEIFTSLLAEKDTSGNIIGEKIYTQVNGHLDWTPETRTDEIVKILLETTPTTTDAAPSNAPDDPVAPGGTVDASATPSNSAPAPAAASPTPTPVAAPTPRITNTPTPQPTNTATATPTPPSPTQTPTATSTGVQ